MEISPELMFGGVLIVAVAVFFLIYRHNKKVLLERKKSLTNLSAGTVAEKPSSSAPSPDSAPLPASAPSPDSASSPDSAPLPASALPEMGSTEIKNLSSEIKKYDGHFSTLAKGLRDHQVASADFFEKVIDTAARQDGMLRGIRDYLAMKNDVTARLQEGYDYRILKNFAKQIIRCIQQLDTDELDETGMDPLQKMEIVRCNLLDVLDRHGIEKVVPDEGTPFADVRKIAEVIPQKEPTSDENLAGKVAEVIRPGYRYVVQHGQHRIIMPAQVKVYELVRSI